MTRDLMVSSDFELADVLDLGLRRDDLRDRAGLPASAADGALACFAEPGIRLGDARDLANATVREQLDPQRGGSGDPRTRASAGSFARARYRARELAAGAERRRRHERRTAATGAGPSRRGAAATGAVAAAGAGRRYRNAGTVVRERRAREVDRGIGRGRPLPASRLARAGSRRGAGVRRRGGALLRRRLRRRRRGRRRRLASGLRDLEHDRRARPRAGGAALGSTTATTCSPMLAGTSHPRRLRGSFPSFLASLDRQEHHSRPFLEYESLLRLRTTMAIFARARSAESRARARPPSSPCAFHRRRARPNLLARSCARARAGPGFRGRRRARGRGNRAALVDRHDERPSLASPSPGLRLRQLDRDGLRRHRRRRHHHEDEEHEHDVDERYVTLISVRSAPSRPLKRTVPITRPP